MTLQGKIASHNHERTCQSFLCSDMVIKRSQSRKYFVLLTGGTSSGKLIKYIKFALIKRHLVFETYSS